MSSQSMNGPQSFKFNQTSPLESLAQRTSSRRGNVSQPSSSPSLSTTSATWRNHQNCDRSEASRRHRQSPSSPVLHTQFRNSTTSTTINDSDLDYSRLSDSLVNDSQVMEYYRHGDDDSVYSTQLTPTYFDPFGKQTGCTGADIHSVDTHTHLRVDSPAVPTLVVTNHDPEIVVRPASPSRKIPVLARQSDFSDSRQRPVLPSGEGKRMVLERNSPRSPVGLGSQVSSPVPQGDSLSLPSASPVHLRDSSSSSAFQGSTLSVAVNSSRTTPDSSTISFNHRTLSSTVVSSPQSGYTTSQRPGSSAPVSVVSSVDSRYMPRKADREAHSAADQTSIIHPYDQNPDSSLAANYLIIPDSNALFRSRTVAQNQLPTVLDDPVRGPSPNSFSPQEYLQLGIQHHEANRLEESAKCFEKSAKEQGGCGVGMLMFGLALRHGWGCEKNERTAFKWLQKAAELATGDLQSANEGKEVTVLRRELVIAIYEVAQCFFHGWGVSKDKKMAVNYYLVAARLGDVDAQQDLAFCLVNGKGCKKDRKEAAKWYRAAVAQGANDVGLAWIYKEKFA